MDWLRSKAWGILPAVFFLFERSSGEGSQIGKAGSSARLSAFKCKISNSRFSIMFDILQSNRLLELS